MRATGRTLHVALLGVRVKEARQYYVQLSVHDEGLGSRDEGNACRPEEVARTETAPLAINPDFMNRVFVMRLQQSLGVSLRPRSLLNVQLWAKPIMERGKCHMGADGRESDELMGQATLTISGDTAARMLRGERATVAVTLDSTTSVLTSGKDPKKQGADLGGGRQEVLVEVMLLDTEVALPRLQAGSLRPAGAMQQQPACMSAECTALVLVSRATSVPRARIPREANTKLVPCFVALKTQRDLSYGCPAQAVTGVAAPSSDPVWDDVLQANVMEGDLESEVIMLAIMNDETGTLMASASIPMRSLRVGQHYNLKLALTSSSFLGDSEDTHLYVTVCLSRAPQQELVQWRACTDKSLTALQARLAACSADLSRPPSDADPAEGADGTFDSNNGAHDQDSFGVVATYTLDGVAPAPALSLEQLYTTAGPDRDAVASAIAALTPPDDPASVTPASVTPASVTMPITAAGSGALLWPLSHSARLAFLHAQRKAGCLHVTLHRVNLSGPATLLGCSTVALASLPAAGDGDIYPFDDCELAGGAETAAGLPAPRATIEARHWSYLPYLKRLQQAAPESQTAAEQWSVISGPVSGASRQQNDDSAAWGGARAGGAQQSSSATGVASLLEQLVDDMICKEGALGRLQRVADLAGTRAEFAAWRVKDLDGKNRALLSDVLELRKMLHAERRVGQGLAGGEGVQDAAQLPHQVLLQQHRAQATLIKAERTKSAELLRRLQEMHGQQVDTLQLAASMDELQRAHAAQSAIVQDLEERCAKVPVLKSTAQKQEQVIVHLEGLLKRTVSELRSHKDSTREAQRLRAELTRLQEEKYDEIEMAKQLSSCIAERDDALEEAQECRDATAAASERADHAEIAAQACEDELLQVTRKCGGEIAQLQARLMEKEAQLIGGFGNPIKLANARWANTPPYTPQWGTSTDGGGAPGALGKYPFGFEEMKRLASNTQPPSETASSMHSDSKLGRRLTSGSLRASVASAAQRLVTNGARSQDGSQLSRHSSAAK